MSARRSVSRRAGAVAALLLTLAGACGSGPGTAPASPRAASQATEEAPSRHLRVGLMEWSILTSTHRVRPGTVHLVVTNTGGTEHDLVVQGGTRRWRTEPLDPGDRARLTVHARPGGRLKLWCSEPGHEAQGMYTTLSVTG